ncbi:unnamed protein product, partial [Chrysoparadoxa australica]
EHRAALLVNALSSTLRRAKPSLQVQSCNHSTRKHTKRTNMKPTISIESPKGAPLLSHTLFELLSKGLNKADCELLLENLTRAALQAAKTPKALRSCYNSEEGYWTTDNERTDPTVSSEEEHWALTASFQGGTPSSGESWSAASTATTNATDSDYDAEDLTLIMPTPSPMALTTFWPLGQDDDDVKSVATFGSGITNMDDENIDFGLQI